MENKIIKPIAHFCSPFKEKFGVPKQSGLVNTLQGTIVFEKEYSNMEIIKGLEEFDYLWIIWGFSANKENFQGTTVRPPLLGGNIRMGVFATRSPFRPNGLGLSSVKISRICINKKGLLTIEVFGADLINNTPIYDIKPYIKYADSHPDARSGFVDTNPIQYIKVEYADDLKENYKDIDFDSLTSILQLDPRPHYHKDNQKDYCFEFQKHAITFCVQDKTLLVTNIEATQSQ
jgi:methyltransferase, YaeB family